MPEFTLETLVVVTMEFASKQAAIEWAQNHNVLDMLDNGASNGEMTICNEDGDVVAEIN